MSTTSPVDSKKTLVRSEETKAQPPTEQNENSDTNTNSNAEGSQPLAPPPRPAQQNPSDTPDYFGAGHNSHFSLEPNPFEQSFSNPSADTPGKSLLPPVAALTSPASLIPGGSSAGGFNWPNSLRSGPLSPAMLTGPTGASDYFGDSHYRGGFPTPNESSLRTGLTPGGGGSMFPAPSPNSQALFNQLASGGATPSTLDFHRTAMNAAARKSDNFGGQQNIPTSQGQEANGQNTMMDAKSAQGQNQTGQQDPFGQHDANDAANGLFLLAQARNGPRNNGQFPPNNQPNAPQAMNMGQMPAQVGQQQSQETSPNLAKRATRNASMGAASLSGSAPGLSENSGEFSDSMSEQAKPSTRKGKKGSATKGSQGANGRRKAEDTPSKPPANKKQKQNNGNTSVEPEGPDSEDEDIKHENETGRKMTDEEKRKNFLERNRVAALKCRQRKKQWLANLQAKVEIFSSENDALSAQVTQLREEIVNLKTLLLAHKDCPVSQAQGLGGMAMGSIAGDFNPHANPYGMAMANGQVMAGQGMPRR
ncbi:MAG: hypothetical protein M1819_003545 [Sarea resinae]|nr:MAG: hypothetical protein M1819_003545 [Sarea resinae]